MGGLVQGQQVDAFGKVRSPDEQVALVQVKNAGPYRPAVDVTQGIGAAVKFRAVCAEAKPIFKGIFDHGHTVGRVGKRSLRYRNKGGANAGPVKAFTEGLGPRKVELNSGFTHCPSQRIRGVQLPVAARSHNIPANGLRLKAIAQ